MFLNQGYSVVVSNNFTRLLDLVPYVNLANDKGVHLEIIKTSGKYENTKNLPNEYLDNLIRNFED